MKQYEVVREVENQCAKNQMRDVFFSEVETDDPVAYVRGLFRDKELEITADRPDEDRVNIFVNASGLTQRFLFTEI